MTLSFRMFFYTLFPLLLAVSPLMANQADLSEIRSSKVRDILEHFEVESLPYGVYLRKVDMIDLSGSFWRHTFRIPRLPLPPVKLFRRLCNAVPSVETMIKYYQQNGFQMIQHNLLENSVESFCKSVDLLSSMF